MTMTTRLAERAARRAEIPPGRLIRPSARQWWLRTPALAIGSFIHSASREPRQRIIIYDSLVRALMEASAGPEGALPVLYGEPLEIALLITPGKSEVWGTCYPPGEAPRGVDPRRHLVRTLAPSAKTWQCGCRELFLALGRPPAVGRYYYQVEVAPGPYGAGFRFDLLRPQQTIPLQRRPAGWRGGPASRQ
jgi:hypothetical protein